MWSVAKSRNHWETKHSTASLPANLTLLSPSPQPQSPEPLSPSPPPPAFLSLPFHLSAFFPSDFAILLFCYSDFAIAKNLLQGWRLLNDITFNLQSALQMHGSDVKPWDTYWLYCTILYQRLEHPRDILGNGILEPIPCQYRETTVFCFEK